MSAYRSSLSLDGLDESANGKDEKKGDKMDETPDSDGKVSVASEFNECKRVKEALYEVRSAFHVSNGTCVQVVAKALKQVHDKIEAENKRLGTHVRSANVDSCSIFASTLWTMNPTACRLSTRRCLRNSIANTMPSSMSRSTRLWRNGCPSPRNINRFGAFCVVCR